MDAKKPRNSSLTSFPILKARKKQNLNPGKVKILDCHWAGEVPSWRLGDLRPGLTVFLLVPLMTEWGEVLVGRDQAGWQTGLGGLGGRLAGGPEWSFVNSRTARPSLSRWLVFEDTLDWCLYYSLLYWALYFWNHTGGVPELSQTFPEKVCVFCFVFP